MEITGTKAGHLAAGKASKKEWKLPDYLQEKITGCGVVCLYGK